MVGSLYCCLVLAVCILRAWEDPAHDDVVLMVGWRSSQGQGPRKSNILAPHFLSIPRSGPRAEDLAL